MICNNYTIYILSNITRIYLHTSLEHVSCTSDTCNIKFVIHGHCTHVASMLHTQLQINSVATQAAYIYNLRF